MDYKSYSEQQLELVKKFLSDVTVPKTNLYYENIVQSIDNELARRKVDNENKVDEFKKKMLNYVGKCYRVDYDARSKLTVFYKINDVAVQDGTTSTYNVLLFAEEITFHDNRVSYINTSHDLRLDNTDIERTGKEISVDSFNIIKGDFERLMLYAKSELR